MRKTVLYIAMSLDGFIAGKNDDISWLSPYDAVDYGFDQFFSDVGAIIQGRRAYEIEVQNGWEYAPVPTFVMTHHFEKRKLQKEHVSFTDEDIEDVLSRARRLTDKNVWIEGGANVAQQFLQRKLIEEFSLFIVPVLLGDGIRLFDKMAMTELSLIEIRTFDLGLVQLRYSPGS